MNRHVCKCFRVSRCGFTLIEVLVAATLTLVMMAGVVQIFAVVGKSINDSRSTLEMSGQIRATVNRLRLDLEGVTADMAPSGRPEEGKGYFEYIEGPIGPDPAAVPGINTDEGPTVIDSTVGDRDDILQFTTRSRGEPFVGRGLVISNPDASTIPDSIGNFSEYSKIVKSQVAEVAWFLRGTTLYRRVLLVSPSFDADIRSGSPISPEAEVPFKVIYRDNYLMYGPNAGRLMGFYNNYDLSVHWDSAAQRVDNTGGAGGGAGKIVCNTLADLTRRECRYAHPPLLGFPFALHNDLGWRQLGLPTLQECSHPAWPLPIDGTMPVLGDMSDGTLFDAWVNPYPLNDVDKDTGSISSTVAYTPPSPPNGGWPPNTPTIPPPANVPRYAGPRVGEDVILTNVLSFDVKAWDPRAPVLQAIDDNTTPGILGDDNPITNSAVMPGDPNYYLALQHLNAGNIVSLSRGAYVDLGYCPTISPLSDFSGWPNPKSQLVGLRIYDTWSIHYEHDGLNQDSDTMIDEGTDGFDNDGNGVVDGVVDDPGEREAPPPYDVPLRGIQIKIRVFDPDSQKVREVTIRHDFLKK